MKKLGFIFLLITMTISLQAGVQGQLRRGGKLYQDEKYGSALNVYHNILKNNPTDQRTLFNAGNAYYRLHEYTQAEEVYKQASEQTGEYAQHALYNLGNAYYKAGDKQKAIEAYKEAIVKNPQDKEAIHNLQLLLQEQQQNQNQNDQNQQNNDDSSDNQQQQQDQQNQQGQQPQSSQESQPKDGQMSKQDADRVMSMAKEKEFKHGNPADRAAEQMVEKDW